MSSSESELARVRGLVSLEAVGRQDGSARWLRGLCRAAVRALPASGAGVSVMGSSGLQGLAVASDARSELVEELQFALGEGPCRDAYDTGAAVLVSDLGDEGVRRWPIYTPAAQESGVQAVFAFPLMAGAARLGVLDVYARRPGPLSREALRWAPVFAEVAMVGLLESYEADGAMDPDRYPAHVLSMGYRVEVYQAQGMLQVQLGVGSSEALARLRAHAFAAGRPLGDVAQDIIDRKLILERDA